MRKADSLSRRERQVMDAVHELGTASAREVQASLADPPSYSAVRSVLSRLVDDGYLRYQQDGPRYVYSAAGSQQRIRRDALRKLVDTFFGGSAAGAINALLGDSARNMTKAELDEISEMIAKSARSSNGD